MIGEDIYQFLGFVGYGRDDDGFSNWLMPGEMILAWVG
jgi:hypothetical protein